MLVAGSINPRFGSRGGLTGLMTTGGMALRARGARTDHWTARSNALRSLWRQLAAHWRDGLTDQQKSDWDMYAQATDWPARVAGPIMLRGWPMYAAANVPRLRHGLPLIDDAPSSAGLADLTAPTISFPADDEVKLEFETSDPWVNEDGGMLAISQTLPQPATRGESLRRAAAVGVIKGSSSSPPSSPQTFTLPLPLASGQTCGIGLHGGDGEGRPFG